MSIARSTFCISSRCRRGILVLNTTNSGQNRLSQPNLRLVRWFPSGVMSTSVFLSATSARRVTGRPISPRPLHPASGSPHPNSPAAASHFCALSLTGPKRNARGDIARSAATVPGDGDGSQEGNQCQIPPAPNEAKTSSIYKHLYSHFNLWTACTASTAWLRPRPSSAPRVRPVCNALTIPIRKALIPHGS